MFNRFANVELKGLINTKMRPKEGPVGPVLTPLRAPPVAVHETVQTVVPVTRQTAVLVTTTPCCMFLSFPEVRKTNKQK